MCSLSCWPEVPRQQVIEAALRMAVGDGCQCGVEIAMPLLRCPQICHTARSTGLGKTGCYAAALW